MHSCAWYRAIPGTTRTETVLAPAVAEGSDTRSSAELVLAELVSAKVVLAFLVLAGPAGLVVDGVALRPPSAVAGLPESVDASLGTVVSVGVRPVAVTGGVADGVVGVALSTVAAEAGLSDGGFGDGVGDVLRACVGRSAARHRSVRGWPAWDGSTWADSAVGAPARDASASG